MEKSYLKERSCKDRFEEFKNKLSKTINTETP